MQGLGKSSRPALSWIEAAIPADRPRIVDDPGLPNALVTGPTMGRSDVQAGIGKTAFDPRRIGRTSAGSNSALGISCQNSKG